MSKADLDMVYRILERHPPLFVIFGGIVLILIGGLIDTELLIFSGWSSFVTGLFLEGGWLFMMNSKKIKRYIS